MDNCEEGPKCGKLYTRFAPLNGVKGTLVKTVITKDETTIVFTVDDICNLSCSGFLFFTGCNGGKKELIYYENMAIAVDGKTVTVSNVTRGLPACSCELDGDSTLAFKHTISEELLINDTSINRYWCLLAECLDNIVNESTTIYNSVTDLPKGDDYIGKRVVVWNNGKPSWYIYWNLGGGVYGWRPIYAYNNQGDTGVQGAIGMQGDTGVAGIDGIQGDTGISGAIGERPMGLQVFEPTTQVFAATDMLFFAIPAQWNGWDLVEARAYTYTAGTTNATTVQVRNVTDAADMLTAPLSIASGTTASGPGTINPATDDVATDDIITIDVLSVSTTPPEGLFVILVFNLP